MVKNAIGQGLSLIECVRHLIYHFLARLPMSSYITRSCWCPPDSDTPGKSLNKIVLTKSTSATQAAKAKKAAASSSSAAHADPLSAETSVPHPSIELLDPNTSYVEVRPVIVSTPEDIPHCHVPRPTLRPMWWNTVT